MAGADALRSALADGCAADVRVIGAPCIGRCEQAPAAVWRNRLRKRLRIPFLETWRPRIVSTFRGGI